MSKKYSIQKIKKLITNFKVGKMKQEKLGYQAPRGYRVNYFNYIRIDGDLSYCASHNFVYDKEEEKRKLYNGEACYFTDNRFVDSNNNFYGECYLHRTRWNTLSIKSCFRKVLKCRNIPVGTVVNFETSFYYPKKKFSPSFKFKVRKENKLDLKFEINDPHYSNQFTNCEFSQKLTEALRKNGFIVRVEKNESFLSNMINTAIAHTGKTDFIDSEIQGDIAIAYGHGKKIGFSSFDNDFMGYSNGCKNILWDRLGEFDKWSRCHEIDKSTPIDDIVAKLMIPNPIEEETY